MALDSQAEKLKLKTRMKYYDCMMEFKVYAEDQYKAFNGRQTQFLINSIFDSEFDI